MQRSAKRRFAKRRVVMLAMLLGVGAFIAWRWTHRHDARLVGRWLVTEDAPATAEQLQAATDRTKVVPKTEWTLHSDGTGRQNVWGWMGSFGVTFTGCRWWTSGDRLCIQWDAYGTGWEWIKQTTDDLHRVLRGDQSQYPVYKYEFAIEGPGLIRVQSRGGPSDVLYLTRLPEYEP
jgi:hypothetical protein